MEKLLKEFTVKAKHSSEQELSLWRNYVMPVKNRNRRFRYVADLEKRLEVQEQKAKIREKLQANFMLYMDMLKSIDGMDVLSERARETGGTFQEDTENEFLNKTPTAGCGIESSQLASIMTS